MRRDRVPAIRIVSYHRTDPRHAGNLEKHFRFFSKYYLPATWNDLTAQISGTCPWTKAKPGIIVAFDDGGLSNFTVARPLLRRFGLTGIFLIPTDWIDTPREKQPEYAKAHRIVVTTRGVEAGLAMNWEQIRQLSLEKDKIVSHTRSHHRFSSLDTPKVLSREIKESKSILEERLHLPIDTFGWVGGESEVYQPAAFKQIQEAGYRYSLSTILGLNRPNTNPFFIRRTAIFDNWSLAQVRFWLLPISDRRYASKEARISRCLGISSSPVARS
jgi:peptidoglycan/xylan/chitin deacetylase (PgdA/CDA1 family)